MGPNPPDRGCLGTRRHLITDHQGIPLTFVLTGANVHDSVPFDRVLDATPAIKGK
jgi:Transposase DDE domain